MKKLYKPLQNNSNNQSHFNLKYFTIKCQTFISNTLLQNPHTALLDSSHWWDNYPQADSVKYYNCTFQDITELNR